MKFNEKSNEWPSKFLVMTYITIYCFVKNGNFRNGVLIIYRINKIIQLLNQK